MPVLTVKLSDKDRHITFVSGRSVRDVLDEADIRVRAGCNGTGACGLCRIRIAGSDGDEPSPNELASLGPELVSQGMRLACQVKVDHDLQIEILNPAPPSVWRYLNEGADTAYLPGTSRMPHSQLRHPLGVAVDLGTTHISLTVLDLVTGRRLSGRRGPNPQASSGSDVLTRLIAAKSEDQAEKLSRQVIQAIADGLNDISYREGIDLRQVARVVLVGNTAMLALLAGKNYLQLLEPRYWTESIDCLPAETASWGASWGINPDTTIEVIAPLAGFVGSDLLSGIVATRLMENEPGSLLIDFGTNSEMVLWDGNNLWVTSAAGGPAFEGCGISCGMPADPGAICRVTVSDAPGALAFEVIAGAESQGLCGSGLVDLLACLVRNGTLNNKGQFAPSVPESGFPLCSGSRELALTKKDIDMFQRAKAAIGVGVKVLLTKAGIGYHELQRIFIGGAFGQYLNVVNAQELGLLPPLSEQMIVTAGNTALSGCEVLLLLPKAEERLREVRNRAMIVNLSNCTNFDTLFLEHLYLRPVSEAQAMIKSLSNKEQLKAFINAAQYFAGLTSGQDIWEEAGKVLIKFFGADFAAFGKYRSDGDIEINHRAFSERGASARISEPEMIAAARDVFESGFLTFCTPPTRDPISTVFLPILHENRLVAVMLVGHLSSTSLAKEILDLYLAVAGLIGAANSRKISEENIRQLNRELEQRVIDRTAQLEITNKELESFAYAVSHDLRAPLRSIDGFSHAIFEDYADRLDAGGIDYLSRIRKAANKMGRLIDALLNLSKYTRCEINYIPVNLSQLAQATADELRKDQPGRHVEFVITDGLTVTGDSTMLHVVVENLLSNAWKYTGKREAARIEFGVTQKDGKDVYFVRDNGAGFDMTHANKLFNAFQRLHQTADFPGLGIGLATVQRIIHRHGGSIWAEAEVEKGATFYFTLQ